MATRDRALLQIGVVGPAIDRHSLQGAIDLDNGRDGARQELAVMAHERNRCIEPQDEVLEGIEPGEVEVVRGFVQQVGVIA